MDFPLLHLYLTCSVLTTIAFIYLIFHFFILNLNKTSFEFLSTTEIESFNENIGGLITEFSLNESKENQQNLKNSSILTSTAKKIISNRKQKNFQDKHHHQCYLPSSDIGLIQMKLINKNLLKTLKKQMVQVLQNRKRKRLDQIIKVRIALYQKKKNLSNWVKKYGFHKTALITIYEQLQY